MLLFVLGLLVGTLIALRVVARRRGAQRSSQQAAIDRAAARLRALEAAALCELADVTQLVPRSPGALVRDQRSHRLVGAPLAGERFAVRWHRVRVPGTACSGLLAEPIAPRQTDGAHQNPGPRGSS